MTKKGDIPLHLFWMVLAFICFIYPSLGGETGEAGGENHMERGPALVLQKGDQGKEVILKKGEVFEIQLEGAGGTGYGWYVRDLDAGHLDLLGEKTKADSAGRLGGPVLTLWTFRAREPGMTEIKLDYYRPWEGIQKAAARFHVRIKIE